MPLLNLSLQLPFLLLPIFISAVLTLNLTPNPNPNSSTVSFYSSEPASSSLKETASQQESSENVLIRFGDDAPQFWQVVNDGVMGGISQSRIRPLEAGHAVFEGVVSLENNGGFASIRTRASRPVDLSGFAGLTIHAKGDGKVYCLRIKTVENGRVTDYAWEARFTAGPEWQTHQLSFDDFRPVFRGRNLRGVPPLRSAAIFEIGLMIRDAQQGPFALEVMTLGVF